VTEILVSSVMETFVSLAMEILVSSAMRTFVSLVTEIFAFLGTTSLFYLEIQLFVSVL
jgi:hypothetical protein